jgi:hypothetical protein
MNAASARRRLGARIAAGKAQIALAVALLYPSTSIAKDTQFWNLTANTITSFQLSPAGKDDWGAEQTANDADRTVDHDERLKIVGVATGSYDVRLVDRSGRTCIVRGVFVKQGAIFSIEEKSLTACQK